MDHKPAIDVLYEFKRKEFASVPTMMYSTLFVIGTSMADAILNYRRRPARAGYEVYIMTDMFRTEEHDMTIQEVSITVNDMTVEAFEAWKEDFVHPPKFTWYCRIG